MSSNADRRFYTIEEAAEVLRCSTSTVRWLIHRGRLESVRPARRRLIPVVALETFIAAGAGR